ncbi:MAG: hypothetical protein KDC12_06505 [Flavobacteriales bacterium]|nr:hypothetical protein [Flavobacteriales bacterium]
MTQRNLIGFPGALAILFIASTWLSGCSKSYTATTEIAQLDSAYQQVEEAEVRFNSIDRFNTANFFKHIKSDLEYVQKNYTGEMEFEPAKVLADYRAVTKYVKDFEHRHTRTKNEIERTKTQLFNLKQALEQGATTDAEGNEISADYVRIHCEQELRIAQELISGIDEMIDRLKQAEQRYTEVHPQVVDVFAQLGLPYPEGE